jgi:predicted MPP superfamily phosphohydrolase
MKLSILHISDLHRDPDNPIGNQPLLDSLENDRQRYTTDETAKVGSPVLIIVSGDIIHGVQADDPDPNNRLRHQYAEALDFLNRLTERFLDGDKSRVVVVPGNHDVSAPHFYKSLQRIDIAPDRKRELAKKLFSRDSALRWSWSDFELYEIADPNLYAQRLAAFSEFYNEFYQGARAFSLDPSSQFDIFDFPEFNVTIVGFCSCYYNDLLKKQGDIHPDCIGSVSMKLREPDYQNRLRIAVWHHSTEGLPLQSDYMNPDILQNLIDRGFSVGFQGHRHRPQFLDTRFRHEGSRRITVISAGTLCGGAAFRFGRAYNIVELDIERRTGLLHLREIQNDNLQLPIWGRRCLPPNSRSYLEFQFDPPPEPMVRTEASTTILIEAQKLYTKGEYMKAAKMLARVAQSEGLAKRLLLDCFGQTNDMAGIIEHFDPPTSATEAIYLIEALWKENRHDRLRQILDHAIIATSTDPSVAEIRTKYALRLRK